MNSKVPLAVLAAALVVLAGCAGGANVDAGGSASVDGDGGADDPTTDGSTNAANGSGESAGSDGGAEAGGNGTVNVFVSDERNAIGDFESLDVTISKVGLHRAGGENGDAETASGSDSEADAEANAAAEADGDVDADTGADANASANATAAEESNTGGGANAATNVSVEADASVETNASTEANASAGAEGDTAADSEGGWVEREVDDVTVDLTELQGAKASRLGSFEAESGKYDRVFVYVSAVEGTLTTGETVRVKLPSGKLHVERGFALGAGGAVDFVFDIAIHEAGKSGKYVLRPVVGESGTSERVEIEDVGGSERRDGDDRRSTGNGTSAGPVVTTATATPSAGDGEGDGELDARFDGTLRAGADATVVATRGGDPVEDAAVAVDGDVVARTDADGRATVPIPAGADDPVVTVEHGGETTTATGSAVGAAAGTGDVTTD